MFAPELFLEGERAGYGTSVDWWGLGALFGEMLLGGPAIRNAGEDKQAWVHAFERNAHLTPLPPWVDADAASLLRGRGDPPRTLTLTLNLTAHHSPFTLTLALTLTLTPSLTRLLTVERHGRMGCGGRGIEELKVRPLNHYSRGAHDYIHMHIMSSCACTSCVCARGYIPM